MAVAVEAPTGHRRPRRSGPRAASIRFERGGRRALALNRLLYPPDERYLPRPATRGECRGGERPCPYVSCRYHLYLDVLPETGSLKLNFPGLEVWELAETCALDVADRGELALEEVGKLVNLTRERIHQIEAVVIEKLRATFDELGAEEDDLTPSIDEPLSWGELLSDTPEHPAVGCSGAFREAVRAAHRRIVPAHIRPAVCQGRHVPACQP